MPAEIDRERLHLIAVKLRIRAERNSAAGGCRVHRSRPVVIARLADVEHLALRLRAKAQGKDAYKGEQQGTQDRLVHSNLSFSGRDKGPVDMVSGRIAVCRPTFVGDRTESYTGPPPPGNPPSGGGVANRPRASARPAGCGQSGMPITALKKRSSDTGRR